MEYYEQHETNRLSQERFVLRVGPMLAAHDRLRYTRAQGFSRSARERSGCRRTRATTVREASTDILAKSE